MGFSRLMPTSATPGLIPCCPTNPRKALKCDPIVVHSECAFAGVVIDIPAGVDCGGTSTETIITVPLPALPAQDRVYYVTGTLLAPPRCDVDLYATILGIGNYPAVVYRRGTSPACNCSPVETPISFVIETDDDSYQPVLEVRRENGPLVPLQIRFESCLDVTGLGYGVRTELVGRKLLETPASSHTYYGPGRLDPAIGYESFRKIPVGRIGPADSGIQLTCRGVGDEITHLYGRGFPPFRLPSTLHYPGAGIGSGTHPHGISPAPWGPETVYIPRQFSGIDEVLWLGMSSQRYAYIVIDSMVVV